MLPKHSQKIFSFLKFSRKKCFCLVSEKTFALHHFLTPKNYFLEALWKQMSVYFCKPPWENVCYKDVAKFYLLVCGVGRGWIIFLKRLAVWVSWNDLQFFKLIEIFRSSTIFQYFDTFNNSIEALKFSRQFGLQR